MHSFYNLFTLWVVLAVSSVGCNSSNTAGPKQKYTKEQEKMTEVTGRFDVDITPTKTDDPKMGLMHLDKTYHGDLSAKGIGSMLTGMTEVSGSAGYVAIERVSGTLKGAKGSFLIQHFGIQQDGEKSLRIQVIPDSGTDDLKGIDGTMEIDIEGGAHRYRFKYSLPG